MLDLGCGTGQLTADLARFGSARVVGVDLSHDMLRQAAERAPERVRANVYALPFADGAFDLVTSSISYHFYEPARWPGRAACFGRAGASCWRRWRRCGRSFSVGWRGRICDWWIRPA